MRLPSAPKTAIDFSSDSDADLLGFMAMREGDPEAARDAFAEFYQRHAPWLYDALCRSRRRLVGSEDGASDLVQDTFRKAYERAHTFELGDLINPDAVRRRARTWLCSIANNTSHDHQRSHDGMVRAIALADLSREPEAIEPEVSLDAETIRDALEALTDRERDVILDTAYYLKVGVGHQRLPNEASAALARRWNTTPENIRAIRSRTIKKIKETLANRPPRGRS
jgi:RNA polymerase sigma factor (sigma-70 family)